MNAARTKAALRDKLITQAEHDFALSAIANNRRWKSARNERILLMALYDAKEITPGDWRPYTLAEIGQSFGLTRECVRGIINQHNSYPLILKRRAWKQKLYREAMAAARRNRIMTVYRDGPEKGEVIPEYRVYRAILQRCFNPNHPSYPNYGGRGVTVHESWLGKEGFTNFFRDMGPRPSGKNANGRAMYSIHRIDNAMEYSPATTKWATQPEQCAEGQRRPPTRVQQNVSREGTNVAA